MGSEFGRRLAAAALLSGLLPALAGPASAADLRGRVRLVTENGGRARGVDVENAVVAFQADVRTLLPPPAEALEMATVRKKFHPEVLIVPRGAEVRFPNFDPILHNVFSVAPGNRFDLGVYSRGDGKSATFDRPGLVRIYCNVHRFMFAHILVLDTNFVARPSEEGTYRLSDLPSGPGTLIFWHPRAEFDTIRVEPPQTVQDLEIRISRHRIPPHLDKFGRPYGGRRDRYD